MYHTVRGVVRHEACAQHDSTWYDTTVLVLVRVPIKTFYRNTQLLTFCCCYTYRTTVVPGSVDDSVRKCKHRIDVDVNTQAVLTCPDTMVRLERQRLHVRAE